MTDDQRFDDMRALPKTRQLIGRAGVTFTRYFASYPVCCPARATFFTGQYAQNHGVRCLYPSCGGGYRQAEPARVPAGVARASRLRDGTHRQVPERLRPASGRPTSRNGWTEWFGLVDHSTYRMWGYQLFENGDAAHLRQPASRGAALLPDGGTDATRPTQFIRRRAGGDAPFFLSVAYLAPHHESGKTQRLTGKLVRPAPRDRGRYAHVPLPKPPSYNEADLCATSRRWVAALEPMPSPRSARGRSSSGCTSAGQSLPSRGRRGVEAIIDTLRDTGELDNTYVIFTSDHGFMQGEHRIPQGKMVPYDPSTQVPMLIRGPGIPRQPDHEGARR